MDSFATTVSVALQYGVLLKDLVNKFAHVRFEPSGFTGNQEIPIAKSIVDYIFRWLGSRFLDTDDKASLGLIDRSQVEVSGQDSTPQSTTAFGAQRSAAPSPDPVSRPVADTSTAAAPTDSISDKGAISETSEAAPPPAASEAQSSTDSDAPKATAVAAESAPRDELAVIATNGNGHTTNGKSGNGNGGGTSAITLNLGATKVSFQTQADAPSCADCGSIMVRNGSCYKCLNCGSTSGCS